MEGKANRSHRYTRTMPWVSVFQAMNITWYLLSRARRCLATDTHHLTSQDPLREDGSERVQKRRLVAPRGVPEPLDKGLGCHTDAKRQISAI